MQQAKEGIDKWDLSPERHRQHPAWGSRNLSYLGIVADGERRDLLCVAEPVIL